MDKKLFFMELGEGKSPIKISELEYHLLCTPDTQATENIVRHLLKKNPNKYLYHQNFATSPSMKYNPKHDTYEQKGTFYIVSVWLANKTTEKENAKTPERSYLSPALIDFIFSWKECVHEFF